MKVYHYIFVLMVGVLLVCMPVVSQAADNTGLEEVLEGFEDNTGSPEEDAFDDVIDGFEDSP